MSKVSAEPLEEFPVWALQPRAETGATAYLSKYPSYDGRGTVIAIFDSGVDPGAGGLQVTTDGKPKVIERIDASGAGDTDMSKVVEAVDGKLIGATGKSLKIPQSWCETNVNGNKFRVGYKKVFPLYPKILKDQVQKARLDKHWNPGHKKNLAKLTNDIEAFEASKSGETVTGKDKLIKDNLDASLDLLMQMDKKMQSHASSSSAAVDADVGPTFDVVSFHNGADWQVIIDNTEDGNLENAIKLRPFSVAQEYASLTNEDNLNVSVNVWDEGNVVEIVSICSSHGTHVASIAAANFPEAPEKNGLAPGAQIISVTIGDGRLGSMETGSALIRAMTYIMQRKDQGLPIDLINMSYGEHSQWSNAGKIGEMIGEVVNKYGVVWAVSAGNAGPALCTIGTPPDIATNTMIGVGAYVSPEMMMAMYSSREKLPGNTYTWTSRGPSMDGDRGVTICAPGGAITSVPRFTNRGSQLMNGTSMACPHTCGALALLLSGLKQRDIAFSPFSVKRALIASAKKLSHVCHYAQGHGLLQVEGAFEHLVQFKESQDRDVRFVVTCNNAHKGIHLRDFYEDKVVEIPIKVEPVFLDADHRSNDEKVAFNVRFNLACSAGGWVKHPKHLDLMYTPRHFLVQVDPTGLEPGVHSAYVNAYDAREPDKGPLFEIPITVVRPEPLINEPRPHIKHNDVTFTPGDIKRHFIKAPEGATWAVVKVSSNEKAATGKFVMHTVELTPAKSVMNNNHEKLFSLSENADWSYGLSVTGGHVLEVCLAKWWANIGVVKVSYTVTFFGLVPSAKELIFHGADGITRLDLKSQLHSEEVQPEAKLKYSVQNYRPSEAKVLALSDRHVIPKDRPVFELQLTYNFSVSKATEITPNIPLLSEVLYESEFISQMWLLYNSHKQMVSNGDAYASKWSVKVDKDDYVLKVYVRHDKKEALDKLTDLPATISSKLNVPINVDIYASHAQASVSGKKWSNMSLAKGATVPVYLTAPNVNEKYTKQAGMGQYLQGTISFAKDDVGKKADSYPLRYILNETVKKDKSKTKKSESSFAESMAEQKINWVGKMDPASDEAGKLFEALKKDESAHQGQLRLARIAAMAIDRKFASDPESLSKKCLKEVIDLVNEIQDLIKEEDVLLFYGTKYDARHDANEIKAEMEKNRNTLIEALAKKGMAYCAQGSLDEATETLFRLLKFTDITDSKVVAFAVAHAEQLEHYGRAIKLVLSQLESKPNSPELEQKLIGFYDKLEWTHCARFAREAMTTKFPPDYELH